MTRPEPIGWPLLPLPDTSGRLRYPGDLETSIEESIRLLLSVRPGELAFHPEFGAGLDELLHEPNTLELRRDIYDRITENLQRWEPRVEIERVDVEEVDRQPTQVHVRIGYRIRRTGALASLGLTLEAGV